MSIDRNWEQQLTIIVPVVSGWAVGPTPIAAFDAALAKAGVENLNLVSLSSIVPPGHEVEPMDSRQLSTGYQMGYGDLAYCVLAEERAASGSTAAGLAWAVDSSGAGGVFLEAHDQNLEVVETDLATGIVDLMERRPYLDFGPPQFAYASGTSDGPSSALVLAIVETRPFNVGID